MTIASTLFFSKPIELGTFARESRDFYAQIGWNAKECAVGWHDDVVRLADDNGCIDYTFQADGTISRRSFPGYCKFIEFVAMDVDAAVDRHNSLLRGTF